MTALTAPNVKKAKKEIRSPAEELHHISDMLEELLFLIKSNTQSNKENALERPSSSNSEVMTVKEAAALLRISLPKMYEFARTGKIHAIEIGRRILVSRSSIMALLMEGEESNGN